MEIKRVVYLGDSITWGFSASNKQACFVNLFHEQLERLCNSKIELLNHGIGANVLSQKCPNYKNSVRPCGLERVFSHCIDYEPQLIVLSYGLNDLRGGLDVDTFIEEYQRMIDTIRENCKAFLIINGLFYVPEISFDKYPPFIHATRQGCLQWNTAIRALAERKQALFVDVYNAMAGHDHLIDKDMVHPNDLGHAVIAAEMLQAVLTRAPWAKQLAPRQSLVKQFMNQYKNSGIM